jgi:hypothetical protein
MARELVIASFLGDIRLYEVDGAITTRLESLAWSAKYGCARLLE